MDGFQDFAKNNISELKQLGILFSIFVAAVAIGICLLCLVVQCKFCRGNRSTSCEEENGSTAQEIGEAEDVAIRVKGKSKHSSSTQPSIRISANTADSNSKALEKNLDEGAEVVADSNSEFTLPPTDCRTLRDSDNPMQDERHLDHAKVMNFEDLCNFQGESGEAVIAVDASWRGFGGYCVLENRKVILYYHFRHDELPAMFRVTNYNDTAELEFRNLLFSLFLFQSFLRNVKLSLYTDNPKIYARKNPYVVDVNNFLLLLEKECNVLHVNQKSSCVYRLKDPEQFVKLIVPADNLSRGKVRGFLDKIGKQYPEMELHRLVA